MSDHRPGDEIDGTIYCTCGEGDYGTIGHGYDPMGVIEENIDRFGWAIQGVFDPENPKSVFAYTAGMERRGLPEVVVYGLPMEVAQTLLNQICDAMVNRGFVLRHGLIVRDLLANDYSAAFIKVNDSSEAEMHMANNVAKGKTPVEAFQLVLPSAKHLWPWIEGYEGPSQPAFGDVPQEEVFYEYFPTDKTSDDG